jgi:hypothetical protein
VQLSLRHWPDMRLTWVSGCAMVHTGPEPGAGMTSLVTKASGSTELAVVVTSHTLRLLPAMMNELADVLAERFPPHCNRVRLVAWNSGCLHDDRPAPAYQLATRLGVEVIAPAGPLLGVPGGSLFAAAGRGAQRPGGWWRFAPGSAPSRVGWRYPAPHWDPDLGEVGELGNDLVVEQVPAGLWLHRTGYRSVTDLVYSVPVDPDNPALIVSHPDEEPLRREELARALAVLPRRTVDRLVFTPYGPDPVIEGRLGEVTASLLGAPTRTRAGLPLYGSGGQRALVTVDCDGRPQWRPFMRELRCNPRTESNEPADWVNPAPDLLSQPIAPATFALGSGWAAEVIEAGLWIRPAQSGEPAEWARTLPLNVDECTIVVGTPSGGYPPPPGALLATLLEQLPADARSRIRFAVPRGAGEGMMDLATSLTDQLPGGAEVRVLTPAGRRRARLTEPSAPTPAHALREPTPYPARPVLQPTPYPPQPVLQPTPYPPQPVLQPTPRPAEQPSRQPAHAARQPGSPPFPPSAHASRQPGRPPTAPQPMTPPRMAPPPMASAPISPAPISPAPLPPAPVPPPTHAARQPGLPPVSTAPISPVPFPPSAHQRRQPSAPPAHSANQQPVYQSAPQSGPGARQPGLATRQPGSPPIASQPPRVAHQPAPPLRATRQPMPQPVAQSAPQRVHQPTPPPMPTAYEAAPEQTDDQQELMPRSEIRSHRTAAGKAGRAGRDDDKTTTSELNRLLGFFDEIRKARAWDEEPAGSRPGA